MNLTQREQMIEQKRALFERGLAQTKRETKELFTKDALLASALGVGSSLATVMFIKKPIYKKLANKFNLQKYDIKDTVNNLYKIIRQKLSK